jgi:hypothetical protein
MLGAADQVVKRFNLAMRRRGQPTDARLPFPRASCRSVHVRSYDARLDVIKYIL